MTNLAVRPQESPRQNQLLAVLPVQDFERFSLQLERIAMPLGETLYAAHGSQRYVYFPANAIVSMVYLLESGLAVELTGIGREGMVGLPVLLGGESISSAAVVRSAGYGYRMLGRALKDEFNRGGAVQRLLLRYTQVLVTQVSQTAICNRGHSIEQQLCRWLLATLDSLQTNELVLTHELVAGALGVRREGITEAAGRLQKAGFIRYRRGHITVLDSKGLESRACECHAVLKSEVRRLLA